MATGEVKTAERSYIAQQEVLITQCVEGAKKVDAKTTKLQDIKGCKPLLEAKPYLSDQVRDLLQEMPEAALDITNAFFFGERFAGDFLKAVQNPETVSYNSLLIGSPVTRMRQCNEAASKAKPKEPLRLIQGCKQFLLELTPSIRIPNVFMFGNMSAQEYLKNVK